MPRPAHLPAPLPTLALAAWLLWRGLAGAGALARAGAELDLAGLRAAASAPLAERMARELGPLTARLRERIERLTPRDARVYVSANEVSPAVHRLWAGLFATCFPRVVLPHGPEKLRDAAEAGDLGSAPRSFVVCLAPCGDAPWKARARLLEASACWELWSLER